MFAKTFFNSGWLLNLMLPTRFIHLMLQFELRLPTNLHSFHELVCQPRLQLKLLQIRQTLYLLLQSTTTSWWSMLTYRYRFCSKLIFTSCHCHCRCSIVQCLWPILLYLCLEILIISDQIPCFCVLQSPLSQFCLLIVLTSRRWR